ncbi:MAG: hypothetical protein JWP75_834, partial [Frondihabitans sp.]|nr:hypothetical protein [Frondihabitans sp.]
MIRNTPARRRLLAATGLALAGALAL